MTLDKYFIEVIDDCILITIPTDKIDEVSEMIVDGFKRNIAPAELAAWIELKLNSEMK